jgi:hypothetical protein
MKGFNCKRFILSLAASIMVTVATLAPLSHLVASGSAYAAPTSPYGFVHVAGPATFIDTSTTTSTISVETQYSCSPSTPSRYITSANLSLTLTQPTGTGTGRAISPSIICDNHEHNTHVTVTTNKTRSTPSSLGVGIANFYAILSKDKFLNAHDIIAITSGNIDIE